MRDKEITVSEAAERLGLSRSTVLRLIDENEFDARRRTRNGPWYISEDSVEEYEDDLDDDDEDEEDGELERAHADGYREGLAQCDEDDDDDSDD